MSPESYIFYTYLFRAIALLIALSVHEFAHAWTAYKLGDYTAKAEGRLTLNPLSHLDPLGTIMIILVGFGWGKPVPFNQYALKNQRWGTFLIALAGATANFITAFIFAIPFYLNLVPFNVPGRLLLEVIIFINIALMVFNLLPIPPLDGSKVFYSAINASQEFIFNFERNGPFLLFSLIFLEYLGIFPIFSGILIPVINFILNRILLIGIVF